MHLVYRSTTRLALYMQPNDMQRSRKAEEPEPDKAKTVPLVCTQT